MAQTRRAISDLREPIPGLRRPTPDFVYRAHYRLEIAYLVSKWMHLNPERARFGLEGPFQIEMTHLRSVGAHSSHLLMRSFQEGNLVLPRVRSLRPVLPITSVLAVIGRTHPTLLCPYFAALSNRCVS